jgi:hypothetical protein
MNDQTNSNVDEAPGPEELEVIRRSFDHMHQTLTERDAFRQRAEHYEHEHAIAVRQIEELRLALKKSAAERDHYLKFSTALTAGIEQVSAGLVATVQMARSQSYGSGPAPTEEKQLPSVLRGGSVQPANQPESRHGITTQHIDFDALAKSINGPARQ